MSIEHKNYIFTTDLGDEYEMPISDIAAHRASKTGDSYEQTLMLFEQDNSAIHKWVIYQMTESEIQSVARRLHKLEYLFDWRLPE